MRIFSEEYRRKLSEGKKGDKNPNHGQYHGPLAANYGRKLSDEWKRRIGEAGKGKHMGPDNPMFGRTAEKNPTWRGNDVGYHGVHKWIYRYKQKPERCEMCKERSPYDAANLSGSYDRDLNDWMYLCRPCHKNIDRIFRNFIRFGRF